MNNSRTTPVCESVRSQRPDSQLSSSTTMTVLSTKVKPVHTARLAIVYVRQSTQKQVLENSESTSRQYALVDRAEALGWSADRVEVIDDDLGQSGASRATSKLVFSVPQAIIAAFFNRKLLIRLHRNHENGRVLIAVVFNDCSRKSAVILSVWCWGSK